MLCLMCRVFKTETKIWIGCQHLKIGRLHIENPISSFFWTSGRSDNMGPVSCSGHGWLDPSSSCFLRSGMRVSLSPVTSGPYCLTPIQFSHYVIIWHPVSHYTLLDSVQQIVIIPCIHPLLNNHYLLSLYYVPGTVLDSGAIAVEGEKNQQQRNLFFFFNFLLYIGV